MNIYPNKTEKKNLYHPTAQTGPLKIPAAACICANFFLKILKIHPNKNEKYKILYHQITLLPKLGLRKNLLLHACVQKNRTTQQTDLK